MEDRSQTGRRTCSAGPSFLKGKGLMIGVETVKDPVTREKEIEKRNKIIQNCFKKGLLILGCVWNAICLRPAFDYHP
jgi:4-aminobutyrate aminotransferase-like enzyme